MLLIWITAGFPHKKDIDNFNQNTASLKSFIFKLLNIQNTVNNSKKLKSSNCQVFLQRNKSSEDWEE